jgi:GTP-binding protein HflX
LKAIIIECKPPNSKSRVHEAKTMAESIGYSIEQSIVQNRNKAHGAYCIGPGKLKEAKNIVYERNIDAVIFTNTLRSSQAYKIQRELGEIRVIDRNLLILEVFDKRAMTKEAKLQIELARLRYTFSWGRELIKLKDITTEQVGWSGPGDYPFSEYEKAARKRISKIKRELTKMRSKRKLQRVRRQKLGFPIVALTGYTQSGKTTFFNKIVSESKDVGLGPFTTLSSCSRLVSWKIKDNELQYILVDSIGFIENMHSMIIDAFEVTLDEICNADLLLLFVDASESINAILKKIYLMNKILRRIEANSDIIICANKIDIANRRDIDKIRKIIKKVFLDLPFYEISSKTGENVEYLLNKIGLYLHNKSTKKPTMVAG